GRGGRTAGPAAGGGGQGWRDGGAGAGVGRVRRHGLDPGGAYRGAAADDRGAAEPPRVGDRSRPAADRAGGGPGHGAPPAGPYAAWLLPLGSQRPLESVLAAGDLRGAGRARVRGGL